MIKLFSFCIVTIIFISGCNASKTTTTSTSGDPLTANEWRLTELQGVPITATVISNQDLTLKFSREGNRVSGFSGCNTFGGSYTTPAPTKLAFSQMMSTMKACATHMDLEAAYMKMLQEVDNYSVNGNTLSLNKAKMAPLARFVAIKAK
jgi:heat shock protein HslJ